MPRDEDEVGVDAAITDRLRRILSEVEKTDFERVEPPTDLWGLIEASVTSDPLVSPRGSRTLPKEPPSRDAAASTVVEYWIDADDVVTDVGQSWADFARDSDAPELAVPAPDRSLWSYFGDDAIRELWQLLVERVRGLQTECRVPFRCDAPHVRRWFDMTITPEPNGRAHFRCALVFEESRPPVALLDLHSERDDGLRPVPVCGWCGRGQYDSLWLEIEEVVHAARLLERTSMPPISHGICASCREEMSAELLVPGGAGESQA
ncbi:MAG: hypothetical protein GY698_16765 [Actinomycetia bacterium]|nr:hypothetical protein [Actinomycetes bacterium]